MPTWGAGIGVLEMSSLNDVDTKRAVAYPQGSGTLGLYQHPNFAELTDKDMFI